MARHVHASAELTHQGPRVSLAIKQNVEVMAFACINHSVDFELSLQMPS